MIKKTDYCKIANQIWSSEIPPAEWNTDIIIRLPKKGDQSNCDN